MHLNLSISKQNMQGVVRKFRQPLGFFSMDNLWQGGVRKKVFLCDVIYKRLLMNNAQ